MAEEELKPYKGECKHCGGEIAIRNPKGNCDHLYYPESCEVCFKAKGIEEEETK